MKFLIWLYLLSFACLLNCAELSSGPTIKKKCKFDFQNTLVISSQLSAASPVLQGTSSQKQGELIIVSAANYISCMKKAEVASENPL